MFDVDHTLVVAFQGFVLAHPFLEAGIIFCARWMIFANAILAVILLTSRKPLDRHAVREAAWSALLVLASILIISRIFDRQRPFQAWSDVQRLIPIPLNPSFPSGHTAASFAMASAFYYFNKNVGIMSFIIAMFVGLGRFGVGVHYPTDVLGGAVAGVLAFAAVRSGHRAIRKPDLSKSGHAPTV